jgi:hypothetical protein
MILVVKPSNFPSNVPSYRFSQHYQKQVIVTFVSDMHQIIFDVIGSFEKGSDFQLRSCDVSIMLENISSS